MAFFKGKFYLLYGVLLYPQNYLYHIAVLLILFITIFLSQRLLFQRTVTGAMISADDRGMNPARTIRGEKLLVHLFFAAKQT